MLGREPTLIIQSIVGVLTVVQLAAITMPTWLHTAIAAALVGLGAIVNRQVVTPVTKAPAPPAPAPPAVQ